MIPVRVDSDKGAAPVCAGAVLVMVAVAVLMTVTGPVYVDVYRDYGLVPARFLSAESWSLLGPLAQVQPIFTHIWVHDGVLHLLVNVWWLWLFGAPIERQAGSIKFCGVLLGLSVFAAMGHVFVCASSIAPLVGSSGLVAGCMGAYVLVMPQGRILMLIPTAVPWTLRLHAAWFVGAWVCLQLILALSTRGVETEVAWWAHVTGFICGLLAGTWLRSQSGDRDADSLAPGTT